MLPSVRETSTIRSTAPGRRPASRPCRRRRQRPDLLDLDLVRDPQDLEVVGHRVLVAVDSDDPLVALLQSGLVLEGRLGDLRHEPAVLDPAQQPAGHRPLRGLGLAGRRAHLLGQRLGVGVGERRAAHGQDLVEDLVGLGLDPVGELLDVPAAAQRVGDVDHAGLLHDHLLGAQGDLGGLFRRQRERLVEGVGVQRVGAAEHGGECLDAGADHVVVGLLGGQRDAGGLGVEPQPLGLLAGGAVDVAHPARPDPAGRTELGDLLEEVDVGVEEEGQSGGEDVDVETAGEPELDVPEPVRKREGELLRGRRAGLADVVAGDGERLVGRDLLGAVLHQVADQAQVRLGAEEPLLLGDVLLEDVGLQRAVQLAGVDLGPLGGHEHHAEDRDRGTADRHRRGHVTQVDPVEEDLHVGRAVDGHAAVSDLTEGHRVVGVAAHQGRHVEGHRQPAATAAQDHLVALVCLLSVAEASELTDRPRAAAVAGGVQAAGVGELARPLRVVGAVGRLHGDAAQRAEVDVAHAGLLVPGLPAGAGGGLSVGGGHA